MCCVDLRCSCSVVVGQIQTLLMVETPACGQLSGTATVRSLRAADLTPEQYVLLGREDIAATLQALHADDAANTAATHGSAISPAPATPARSPLTSPVPFAFSPAAPATPLSWHESVDTPRIAGAGGTSAARSASTRSTPFGSRRRSSGMWPTRAGGAPVAPAAEDALATAWHSR